MSKEYNFVIFAEAIKALEEEETVYFHFGNEIIEIWCEKQVNDLEVKAPVEVDWRDLVFGKWTIGV